MRPTAFAVEGGGFVITLKSGDEFHFDPAAEGWDAAAKLAQWLRRHELRLSPRALMLTLFMRLCVADQFMTLT